MELSKSTALVTGANRGIGRHFALQLLERGAAKVYATARNPELVDFPGVEVLQLPVSPLRRKRRVSEKTSSRQLGEWRQSTPK